MKGQRSISCLLDITGSMSPVIESVKNSTIQFVNALVSSGLKGTIGVVTFQDPVGVNVSFQQPAPGDNYERSPFYKPVPLDNTEKIEELKSFILKLEANRGADAPENIVGAIDFARNNVIGYTSGKTANVIGDGTEDPNHTEAWPVLSSNHQVFVVFTDISFHSESRNESNSSLLKPFVPRSISDILASLKRTHTIVNVVDPSWVDISAVPTGLNNEVEVDADFWAINTGGIGEDVIQNKYSLLDLEKVIVASDTGLLDITLDKILATTCFVEFDYAQYTQGKTIDLIVTEGTETFSRTLTPAVY